MYWVRLAVLILTGFVLLGTLVEFSPRLGYPYDGLLDLVYFVVIVTVIRRLARRDGVVGGAGDTGRGGAG